MVHSYLSIPKPTVAYADTIYIGKLITEWMRLPLSDHELEKALIIMRNGVSQFHPTSLRTRHLERTTISVPHVFIQQSTLPNRHHINFSVKMTSNVGSSGVYEAGDQRNVKDSEIRDAKKEDRFEEGKENSHVATDSSM